MTVQRINRPFKARRGILTTRPSYRPARPKKKKLSGEPKSDLTPSLYGTHTIFQDKKARTPCDLTRALSHTMRTHDGMAMKGRYKRLFGLKPVRSPRESKVVWSIRSILPQQKEAK